MVRVNRALPFNLATSLSPRQIDVSDTSSNSYDVCIVWLDTNMDPRDLRTGKLLFQLNDRVELFNDLQECLDYLREQIETILFIVSGKCAAQCLRSIHSLRCIDSIVIYCASPEKYRHLTSGAYTKILACVSSESDLIQYVRSWISLKCQAHFYAWNKSVDENRPLMGQTALFLAYHFLMYCIQHLAFRQRKEEMLTICREYYAQRPRESALIEEFELTYTPADAIMWFTRNSFIHKIVNRAFRSFDKAKLAAVAFYLQDLRDQLKQHRFKADSSNRMSDVYHGLVMTRRDIDRIQALRTGSLLTVNGFLSTSRVLKVAQVFAEKRTASLDHALCYVLLQIHLNFEESPIIFADVREFSAYPTEEEVLFDLGTVFCVQKVSYDDETRFWTVYLTLATYDDYQSIDRLAKMVEYQYGGEPNGDRYITLIDKLLTLSASDETSRRYDDREQNWSLLRQNLSNHLWSNRTERFKFLLEGTMKHLLRTCVDHLFPDSSELRVALIRRRSSSILDLACKTSRSTSGAVEEIFSDQPLSRSRFEPVVFFRLHTEALQEERLVLSRQVSFAYRRVIPEHLTLDQVDANLREFAVIFYVASELPSYMKNNPGIKFYALNLPADKNDERSLTKGQIMERCLGQVFQDLGIFYTNQALSLPDDSKHQVVRKRLLEKAGQCYQSIVTQTDEMIQRYQRGD